MGNMTCLAPVVGAGKNQATSSLMVPGSKMSFILARHLSRVSIGGRGVLVKTSCERGSRFTWNRVGPWRVMKWCSNLDEDWVRIDG